MIEYESIEDLNEHGSCPKRGEHDVLCPKRLCMPRSTYRGYFVCSLSGLLKGCASVFRT